MATLSHRMVRLEVIAEQTRRAEIRHLVLSLPEARGLLPAEIEAATDEAIRFLDCLRRAGGPATSSGAVSC